jgi:surface antigen
MLRTVKNLRLFLIVPLAFLLVVLGPASTALASGAGLFLRSNVTSADSVGITVVVGGFRFETCQPTITKDNVSAFPDPINTGRKGGAKWSWHIPGNVNYGKWKFSVACSGGRKVHHGSKIFSADGGTGPSAKGLWIPGTMKVQRVRIKTSSTGIGNGGGEGSLYPFGQCTWWVAKLRPDLPLFPGKSGNALNWAKSGKRAGFPVGVIPALHAVAVFQPGQYQAGPYGHVAYVTAVRGDEITISEANFRGRRGHSKRTIDWSGLEFIYRKGEMGPPPTVSLLSPQAGSIVQGTTNLVARSNSPGIRFEVFWYANPADRHSKQETVVAEDKDPSDGFSAAWNTTTIPNQGGPGGSSVVVSAIPLDGNGNPTENRASARVNVANSRTENGQTYYPYSVVGTCDDGQCGLNIRSGPGYSEYPLVGKKYDGEEVRVVCQGYGEAFTSPSGGSSRIWDKLTDGNWVIDYYVSTPGRGVPSQPLPPCP